METTLIENASGNLITKSEKIKTGVGVTKLSSFACELTTGNENREINLVSFVEKRPILHLFNASPEEIAEWKVNFGSKSVERKIRYGKVNEILFRGEIDNMLHLNQAGNISVPKVIDHSPNYYKMQFITGISGERINRSEINRETKLAIVKKTLSAIKGVFTDGVLNLEHAPKNSIIVPNLKTGVPERVSLIDFGVSFQIDSQGKIEVDMDLFNDSGLRIYKDENGEGLFPPELYGQKGKVKIDAEKCLVWSLMHRVVGEWLRDEKIPGFNKMASQAISNNPEERQTLDNVIDFFEKIQIDETKIGSCVSDKTLKTYQNMLGKSDTEVFISEKDADRIAQELSQLQIPY